MKLYPSNYLRGRTIQARDREIGTCVDFLFDDLDRTIRYLVVDTRKWLPGRRVVISPAEVGDGDLPDPDGHLVLDLSREQIRNSPPLKEHAPLSMRIEECLSAYYGWPVYWAGADPWGDTATIPMIRAERNGPEHFQAQLKQQLSPEKDSSWLRSIDEVCNYRILTPDGELGHIEDFVFETAAWSMPYFIVDTRNWWPGRKLAVPQSWFDGFDAFERVTQVRHSRHSLESCPEVNPRHPFGTSDVAQLQAHFAQRSENGHPLSVPNRT